MGTVGPGDDVLVIGDVMVDVVVSHDGPIEPGSDAPSRITMQGGGSGANTACWLGSLGRAVCLGASVGDDELAKPAVTALRPFVAALGLSVDPDRATGTCVVLVDAAGQRTMFPDRGANDSLGPGVVLAELPAEPEPGRHRPARLHVSGYSLLGTGSHDAARLALLSAAEAGVPSSVDAASSAPLRAVGAEVFLGWIQGVDLLFANDDEVDALGGEAAILAHVGALVTKRGAAGATWTDGRGTESVPAVQAEVVDTTGAGDAFAAGYLDAVLGGADPRTCLDAGARVAAVAVSHLGARPPA